MLPKTWLLGRQSYPPSAGTCKGAEADRFGSYALRLGFCAVEPCDRTIDLLSPAASVREIHNYGVSTPSFAVRTVLTEPEVLDAEIAHGVQAIQVAASVLRSRVVRVTTGWHRADRAARRSVEVGIESLVSEAALRSVLLVVETHGGLSNDLEFLNSLSRRYASFPFGICLDFGNVPRERHLEYVETLAPVTKHVHVKTFNFCRSGAETSIDVPRCIRLLLSAGYSGLWVIEHEGREPREPGILSTVQLMWQAMSG